MSAHRKPTCQAKTGAQILFFVPCPGATLPPCHGIWGTLHTGDGIDCNTCSSGSGNMAQCF